MPPKKPQPKPDPNKDIGKFFSVAQYQERAQGRVASKKTFVRWLKTMNIKMRSTKETSARALPENWEREADDMYHRVAYLCWKEHIPPELVVNATSSFTDILKSLYRILLLQRTRTKRWTLSRMMRRPPRFRWLCLLWQHSSIKPKNIRKNKKNIMLLRMSLRMSLRIRIETKTMMPFLFL